jgi:hypothetical protein
MFEKSSCCFHLPTLPLPLSRPLFWKPTLALNDCEEEDEDEDEQKGGAQLSFEHALNPAPRANSNVAADRKVRSPAPPFATWHPQKPLIAFRNVPVLQGPGALPMLCLLEYIPGLTIPVSL